MKLSAIIPVKTLSNAKSRLNLAGDAKEQLCRIMLEEVLRTVSASGAIDSTVVVSGDRRVFEIAEKFGVVEIREGTESGVNGAVALADAYLEKNSCGASVVFPQDIPFMMVQDIDFLLQFQRSPCALIVPSRKFDGTNALLRSPPNLMPTHYDEDSYKIHLDTGRKMTKNTSLVFVRRIMMDIDDDADLKYCLARDEKPGFCEKIRNLL